MDFKIDRLSEAETDPARLSFVAWRASPSDWIAYVDTTKMGIWWGCSAALRRSTYYESDGEIRQRQDKGSFFDMHRRVVQSLAK